ncbi:hypothetical protein [Colwellia sp. C1TZA3]|uniref:hypothetical protein n=1 Tax=Colwellia sp. C1TZA3 TaxID=2508879 RepID=UPI0011B98A37|nr:hypothetical protein [Colwellia sp. C1TZA3]TWX73898.1 hypothetical protein ESZ39_01865 [Colwellia sp. C1TZA3]
MIALITLQSTFAMADSCDLNINNEPLIKQQMQLKSVAAEFLSTSESPFEQEINQDECLDCNDKCCPCCSSSMFTTLSVKTNIITPEIFSKRIESTKFDTLYYSFKRPPKA